jgi:hypothetical protein
MITKEGINKDVALDKRPVDYLYPFCNPFKNGIKRNKSQWNRRDNKANGT